MLNFLCFTQVFIVAILSGRDSVRVQRGSVRVRRGSVRVSVAQFRVRRGSVA